MSKRQRLGKPQQGIMSKDRGYIKLYRDIWQHEIWNDRPFSRGQAWVDLIMLVNHEDKKILFDGDIVCVKKGETITSLRKLADRWGWSIGKVGRFLNVLEGESMLIQKRNSKRTTISIVNYCFYQEPRNTKRNTERTLTEHRRNTDGNKQDTIKDTIEGTKKNIGATRPFFIPPTVEEVAAYCRERGNAIKADHFIDYYAARGWELSKGRKMKDWRAAVRTWEQNAFGQIKAKQEAGNMENQKEYKDIVEWGF